MPEDTVSITHAEALRLIDEQVGERVYVGFLVARADPDDPEGPTPFVHRLGPLKNRLAPKPPRLDPDVGYYEMGRSVLLAGDDRDDPSQGQRHRLPGRRHGVDPRCMAWQQRGGNPWSQPADLPRLLAKGQRARAEILEASPTEHKVAAGEDERRIWSLRLHVHPDGEPAFEALAEHGFRPSPDFEEKIERGDSIKMVPEGTAEVEVLFDPLDHQQVVVRPLDDDEGPKGLRLVGIVGRSLSSTEDDGTLPTR